MRVLTDGHTDTHTDGTDSITSTADAGGNDAGGLNILSFEFFQDSADVCI